MRQRTTVRLTILHVPKRVRDELSKRAASQGTSLQKFLLAELERIAARPWVATWLAQVRKRKRATLSQVFYQSILEHRDRDRR